jgi:predicted Zn-dependent peptidase
MKSELHLLSHAAYLDSARSTGRMAADKPGPFIGARRALRAVAMLIALSIILGLGQARADSSNLADRVIEHKLANGMTVLMVERHQTPIVSINMTFGVGGVNEQVGQTGLAHLYEHMAFKGTRKVGTKDYDKEQALLDELAKVGMELERREREEAAQAQRTGTPPAPSPELDALQRRFKELQEQAGQFVVGNEMALLYQRNGGVGLNASTGKDITRYVISLPANRLPLWAALESDRMAHPVLREFYKERGVVMEERRLRTDDSPTARTACSTKPSLRQRFKPINTGCRRSAGGPTSSR